MNFDLYRGRGGYVAATVRWYAGFDPPETLDAFGWHLTLETITASDETGSLPWTCEYILPTDG
jgi:hypothetical protein